MTGNHNPNATFNRVLPPNTQDGHFINWAQTLLYSDIKKREIKNNWVKVQMKTTLVCGRPPRRPRGVDSSWPCTCIHLLVGLSVRSFCLQFFKASSLPYPPPPPFPLEVPHLVITSTDTFWVITPLVISLQTGSLVRVHRKFWQCARKIGAHPNQISPKLAQVSLLADYLVAATHRVAIDTSLLWSDSYLVPPTFKAPAPKLIYFR